MAAPEALVVGLVVMVGLVQELAARSGLWCRGHRLSNSRMSTMIPDDRF
jgi:hypothetical protein